MISYFVKLITGILPEIFSEGKIYCFANFFCCANFSIAFGSRFGEAKVSEGGDCMRGVPA